MADKRDYYEVLGVQKGVSDDDLKKAYRAMVKKYHPDLHPDDKDAEEKMKEVNEAYDVLSNKDKRARYDQFGFAGVDPSYGAGQQGGYGGGTTFTGDFSGFGDLGDLFEGFFGGFGGQTRTNPNAPRKGQDIRTSVQISFLEACKGTGVDIRVNRAEKCPDCSGSGARAGTSAETCPKCHGTGSVKETRRGMMNMLIQQVVQCDRCGGKGKIIASPCQSCGGTGSVRRVLSKNVNIPQGIDDGQTLRITGEGDCGTNGGPNGDLIIKVNVKPHDIFEREGFDIYSEVPISYMQAALGDEILIPTIDGNVRYRIPAGTQNGDTFHLRGQGVPRLYRSTRGDHHATVRVTVPKNLTRKQADLLKAFNDSLDDRNDPSRKKFSDLFK